MFDARRVRNFCLLGCLAALAACSNGRGSVDSEPPPPPPSGPAQESFTVGGTITGLDGNGLVLQLNGGNDLAVSNDGAFTFTTQLADATAYTVAVLTQPTGPSQTCTIGNAGGTIAAANVTNIAITCATGAFALHVTVSGLAGTGLVLQNNGTDDLPISANGEVSFPTPYASGADYDVTVKTQPSGPSQSCTVANGAGRIGSGDVTNVTVACATGTFSIGVTVSGLVGSQPQLVLQNNRGDDLTINGNGLFQFGGLLASGAKYEVTVAKQPTNPTQSCAVDKGTGTVVAANVTDIVVRCMTGSFTIGGTISGLDGSGLQLRLNNGQPLNVLARAPDFAFQTLLASGTNYVVEVVGQPSDPAQECRITSGGSGIVQGANVTNVAVTCTTRSFRIGGSVSGLRGEDLVLRANDGETLAIASNGTFSFTNLHLSGSDYEVVVQSPPHDPTQSCTIARGKAKVGNGDVRDIQVTCAISTFTVGGTVSDLLGTGLVLQNNGGNNLSVTANGTFTFTTELASGSNYAVTVAQHPSNPTQMCSVVPGTGSGPVVDQAITSVQITCSTSDFAVGGTITNLVGSGLLLQNNGGDDLRVDSGSTFQFATHIPSGAGYNVTIVGQPAAPAQACTIAAGTESGTVTNANVSTVQISCVTTEFSIGGTVTGLTIGQVLLQINGDEVLTVGASGPFTFVTSLPNGAQYSVTVVPQPGPPGQTCSVSPATAMGVVSGANVTNVEVICN